MKFFIKPLKEMIPKHKNSKCMKEHLMKTNLTFVSIKLDLNLYPQQKRAFHRKRKTCKTRTFRISRTVNRNVPNV
jgi:hypothetical protein